MLAGRSGGSVGPLSTVSPSLRPNDTLPSIYLTPCLPHGLQPSNIISSHTYCPTHHPPNTNSSLTTTKCYSHALHSRNISSTNHLQPPTTTFFIHLPRNNTTSFLPSSYSPSINRITLHLSTTTSSTLYPPTNPTSTDLRVTSFAYHHALHSPTVTPSTQLPLRPPPTYYPTLQPLTTTRLG